MKDRKDLRSTSLLVVGVSILSLFVWAGAVATGAERHSGSVVAVDAATRTLVIDEIGANAKEQKLRLRLAPQAQLILSERNDHPEDFQHVFKEVPIGLSDLKPGDFVVVEVVKAGKENLADLVMITLRR